MLSGTVDIELFQANILLFLDCNFRSERSLKSFFFNFFKEKEFNLALFGFFSHVTKYFFFLLHYLHVFTFWSYIHILFVGLSVFQI